MKRGDLVQLNSGGPVMTVDRFQSAGGNFDVVVVWCDRIGGFHRASVGKESLKIYVTPGDK